jgi:hypothetical protein
VRYFKAVAPTAAREPAVTAALARRTPHVPPVLAIDGARRFLLMEGFAGEPLATGDVAVWADVVVALGDFSGSASTPSSSCRRSDVRSPGQRRSSSRSPRCWPTRKRCS